MGQFNSLSSPFLLLTQSPDCGCPLLLDWAAITATFVHGRSVCVPELGGGSHCTVPAFEVPPAWRPPNSSGARCFSVDVLDVSQPTREPPFCGPRATSAPSLCHRHLTVSHFSISLSPAPQHCLGNVDMHTSVPLLIRNCHKKRVWLKTSCIYYVTIFLGQEEGPSLAGSSALGLTRLSSRWWLGLLSSGPGVLSKFLR